MTVFGPTTPAQAFRTPLTKLSSELGALDAGFFDQPLPGGFRGYGHDGATLSFFSDMTVVPAFCGSGSSRRRARRAARRSAMRCQRA